MVERHLAKPRDRGVTSPLIDSPDWLAATQRWPAPAPARPLRPEGQSVWRSPEGWSPSTTPRSHRGGARTHRAIKPESCGGGPQPQAQPTDGAVPRPELAGRGPTAGRPRREAPWRALGGDAGSACSQVPQNTSPNNPTGLPVGLYRVRGLVFDQALNSAPFQVNGDDNGWTFTVQPVP